MNRRYERPRDAGGARRIIDIVLTGPSRRVGRVEHERAVALFDLLEENGFV